MFNTFWLVSKKRNQKKQAKTSDKVDFFPGIGRNMKKIRLGVTPTDIMHIPSSNQFGNHLSILHIETFLWNTHYPPKQELWDHHQQKLVWMANSSKLRTTAGKSAARRSFFRHLSRWGTNTARCETREGVMFTQLAHSSIVVCLWYNCQTSWAANGAEMWHMGGVSEKSDENDVRLRRLS